MDSIRVGQNGTGALSVTGGATLTSGSIYVAGPATSGSSSLHIGGFGTEVTTSGNGNPTVINGTASVNGGAAWSVDRLMVSAIDGNNGALTVDGPNSKLTIADSLSVGNSSGSAKGSLTISHGSTVSINSTVNGLTSYANTTVDIEDSSLTANNIISHGNFSNTTGVVTAVHFQSDGTLNNSGTLTTTSFQSAGSMTNSGTINTPTLTASGTLMNYGIINGAIQLNGTFSGLGFANGLLRCSFGTISPDVLGTMSILDTNLGAVTLDFKIDSANGTAGGFTGWSLIQVLHSADFFSTSGFLTLNLNSLIQSDPPGLNTPGLLSDFDPSKDYDWTVLTSGQGINGFDPNNVKIDTSGFANAFGGTFSLVEVGNDLVLEYRAPEPTSIVLVVLGGVTLLAWRQRRQQLPSRLVFVNEVNSDGRSRLAQKALS